MNDDFEIEDIQVDPDEAEVIFHRNLLQKNIDYLKELEKASLDDYELEHERSIISSGFQSLKTYCKNMSADGIKKVTLNDLKRYIESGWIINRIMYIITRLDSKSPVPSSSNRPGGQSQQQNQQPNRGPKSVPSSSRFPSSVGIEKNRDPRGREGSSSSGEKGKSGERGRELRGHMMGRGISDSGNLYEDEEFEAYTPDDDVFNAHEEEEGVGAQDEELTYRYPRPNSQRSTVNNKYRDEEAETLPRRGVSSSISHDGNARYSVPTNSRSDSHDIQQLYYPPSQNGSLDSIDNNKPLVIGDRIGGGGKSGNRRKQRNPSWITKRNWKLGDRIGSGSFGEVFQAMNDKGKLFAAKRMNIVDKSLEVDSLLSEIQLMRGLSHKHIVEYLGTYVDSEAFYLYIFQEWVPGGSVAHLLKKFGPFSLSVVRNYTRQILLGLQYLHSHHIIHRDIKGGNILVDDGGVVKLADFGASTKLSSEFEKTQEMKTLKGTPYFMAPEVLCSSHYGRKGDIWAVGCTIIQMLTGDPPWKDQNLNGIAQLGYLLSTWNKGPPPFEMKGPEKMSSEGQECIEMCFKKEESERPTAIELLQCSFLQHEEQDLEDSAGSFKMNNSMRNNKNNESHRDMLEDSQFIGLKQEIRNAVSKSMAGLPSYLPPQTFSPPSNPYQLQQLMVGSPQQTTDEDTFQMIERRMPDRNKQQQQIPPAKKVTPTNNNGNNHNSNNPFASRPEAALFSQNSPRTSPIHHLVEKLPQGNNFYSRDSDVPLQGGPKFSKDPTPLSLQQFPSSSSHSAGTTPQSNNPYRAGPNKKPLSNNATPNISRYFNEHANGGIPFSPPSNPSVHTNLTSPVISTPKTLPTGSGTGLNPENLRDSLHIVKRKAQERIGTASGSRERRNLQSAGNQSSNRDTEDLTPLPVDDDFQNIALDKGESKQYSSKPASASTSLYNTRYFDEKRGSDGDSVPYSDFEEEEIPIKMPTVPFPLSRMQIPLERDVSVESVIDEVGDNFNKSSSYDDNDRNKNLAGKVPNQQTEVKYMQSNHPSEGRSNEGTNRRYYYPNNPPATNASSEQPSNVHHHIMKKSSAGEKEKGKSSSPVPRLSGLEEGNMSKRELERRQSQGSEKYAVSASARIVRPEPVVDPVSRPYSSKASFTYNDKSSKNSSAVSSPGKGVEALEVKRSHGSGMMTSASTSTLPSSSNTSSRIGGWKCGKCLVINSPTMAYCEKCSTRKGFTGDRKLESFVPRI